MQAVNPVQAVMLVLVAMYTYSVEAARRAYRWVRVQMVSIDLDSPMKLIVVIVGGVIAFVIIAAMFPTIDAAAADLQAAAQNSSNTLIRALAPVIPYLIGIGLFALLVFPIVYVYKRVS